MCVFDSIALSNQVVHSPTREGLLENKKIVQKYCFKRNFMNFSSELIISIKFEPFSLYFLNQKAICIQFKHIVTLTNLEDCFVLPSKIFAENWRMFSISKQLIKIRKYLFFKFLKKEQKYKKYEYYFVVESGIEPQPYKSFDFS